jgi:hypothetical protein
MVGVSINPVDSWAKSIKILEATKRCRICPLPEFACLTEFSVTEIGM